MPASARAATVISTARVSYHYGRTRVLHEVNLDVPDGATCALLGANGAGKTTLLRLLAGIDAVQEGRVALFGTDVDELTMRQRQQVAYGNSDQVGIAGRVDKLRISGCREAPV
ncbi:ATP-binding cassette domain-containing protein [Gemmatimonas sp.]|uniref:ATP-binding cassette domain-containing protein n=1 Tax=Gemmatimonas sp. TaxID=1962908 RepID=UPI003DA2D02C